MPIFLHRKSNVKKDNPFTGTEIGKTLNFNENTNITRFANATQNLKKNVKFC